MKQELTDTLELSLIAFNGSKNCDKSSAKDFYDSYVERKRLLIENRVEAIKLGDPNVNKNKLMKDVHYLKEATEKKPAVLDFITDFLKEKADENTIEEIEHLLGDINLG